MRTTTRPRVSRIIAWLRDTWAEVDCAQRRMIELNAVAESLIGGDVENGESRTAEP